MLTEFTRVRQIPREGYRRLFTDKDFDLFVWYEDDTKERIVGFQLCYDKRGRQKALTWYHDRGYLHTAVDDGEDSPLKNRSPILVADGRFPKARVLERFREASRNLERELVELVEIKLADYRDTGS